MTDFSSISGAVVPRVELEHFAPTRHSVDIIETVHSGLAVAWGGDKPLSPPQTFQRRFYLLAKRPFDVALAVIAVAILAPLMLAIVIVIRMTSRGPVLFRQERRGIAGTTFELLKFRTMRIEDCDESGVVQTIAGDPRLTPFGAWLRRTSLDEIPQLFNILRGEMSFCGPRPHPLGMLAAGRPYGDIVSYYELRHSVTPGLTGWAQANGLRGPTLDAGLAKARVDHDLAYIQNASLWLDLKIILMTARQEFLSGNGS